MPGGPEILGIYDVLALGYNYLRSELAAAPERLLTGRADIPEVIRRNPAWTSISRASVLR
jgi:hypothetical protein